jgi:hypothetical protein
VSRPKVAALGIYRFPARLGLTGGCLGKSFRIKIGEHSGRATLPVFDGNSDWPALTTPATGNPWSGLERLAFPGAADALRSDLWGIVGGWSPETGRITGAAVGAITCEFAVAANEVTYNDDSRGRGAATSPALDELFGQIDVWFDHLRTWVEVIGDQDADPSSPMQLVQTPGGGLTLVTVEGETTSVPRKGNVIQIVVQQIEPVTLPVLRKLVGLANRQAVPGDAHLLLRDARGQSRRGYERRAVIDAATAVELSLANYCQAVAGNNAGDQLTLGKYVKKANAAGAKLPSKTYPDLVKVRNDAIHKHKTPTTSESHKALTLARQIVGRLEPLPV